MSRRRRGREPQTVSLFPFLAVLICTFGVLIILLVIVVKAADHEAGQAQSELDAKKSEEVEKLKLDLEMQVLKSQGYRVARKDLLQSLSDQKTMRAHLQADIEKLVQELRVVEAQIAASFDEDLQAEDLETEFQSLKTQLADQKDLLKKRRQAWDTAAEVKYSIVPYDGAGGTSRLPIYVECRRSELIIQPYGIRLSDQDFVQPVLPNNPLDAAFIAVREYFLKNSLASRTGTPYPLLVVRPDGANAYAVARQAMKSWDEEFGYELVGADKELEYGEGDPQIRQEMLAAIEGARRRQRRYVADKIISRKRAAEFASVQNAGGLQASSRLGGFVNPGGEIATTSGAEPSDGTDQEPRNEERLETGDQRDSNATRNADFASKRVDSSNSSIADDRGKDWALRSNSENAVAYRRPVKLYLTTDAMVVDSSASTQRTHVAIRDDLAETVDDLVDVVGEHIDKWGVAGAGGYWKPELDVVVLPGAESTYDRIARLLDSSGIELRKEQR